MPVNFPNVCFPTSYASKLPTSYASKSPSRRTALTWRSLRGPAMFYTLAVAVPVPYPLAVAVPVPKSKVYNYDTVSIHI